MASKKNRSTKARTPSKGQSKGKTPKAAPAEALVKGGTAAKAKPAKADGAKKLSALSAAAVVLAASREPMGVKAIIEAMSAKGLWSSPGGKTPHSTLAAALQRDIAAKGRDSRFKKADRGLYAASGKGA
jgi:hypothetical protein